MDLDERGRLNPGTISYEYPCLECVHIKKMLRVFPYIPITRSLRWKSQVLGERLGISSGPNEAER